MRFGLIILCVAVACALPSSCNPSLRRRLQGGTTAPPLVGTEGDDGEASKGGYPRNKALEGTDLADTMYALGGDDLVRGKKGDDAIFGGEGNDILRGQAGDDTVDGGAGDDEVTGQSGDDRLFGGDGKDFINADNGNDLVDGGPGDDNLAGNSGTDRVKGGAGDDLITDLDGDFGDTMIGGPGADTFILRKDLDKDKQMAQIQDFNEAEGDKAIFIAMKNAKNGDKGKQSN
ncbi:unnamed protein product [Vitrella brassicaformis CCMP3155]|uniref:Alkaline phosphatase n=2 Tax=Vitrella brassicaformis TaxID=1169539 RepID=A0A0G4EEV1_VITBC|nr:unnamed protein product [Vitrella brassicaformis CCMP3155]|mmetsp:Transcript_52753/g.132604  ORF Transcript_52753/g.132604 Transcript_52753/m.132604 type:complete len:231 (+) Transcript_52753:575-1267(+)|eukprot:CEL94218.1 unnamed protein product [Vitrella brassicaformis CCMP3155]